MSRCIAVFATLASAIPPLLQAQGLDSLEQAVVVVAITRTRTLPSGSWILLGDRTATFQCDPPLPSIVNLAGCNGMRTKELNESQTLALIKQQIRTVSDSMFAEFRAKNDTSVALAGPLRLSVKQVLWSPRSSTVVPTDLGSPSYAIEISRVAFDDQRRNALVYVSAMNWTDQSQSYGEYVYLEYRHGNWTVVGRARTWNLSPN